MSSWLKQYPRRLLSHRRRLSQDLAWTIPEILETRALLAVNPITVNGVENITATDGKVNQTVGRFSDTDTSLTAKDFKATIDWGDGSTSKGHISMGDGGGFLVVGKHHYKTNGIMHAVVTVSDKSGNSATNGGFSQDNLVSDQAGQATSTDPNEVNAWGLALSPTGPFWLADNGTGLSTVVDGAGNVQSLVVTVPAPPGSADPSAPTGIVFNGTSAFGVTGGPAHFIFATEDGTISGWNNGTTAELKVNNSGSGAIYKGLAIGAVGSANFLYATDFHNNKIDVFDNNYAPATLAGNFEVPHLPKGYAPFGIEAVGGNLIVTYAKQGADKVDEVDNAGFGLVVEFSMDGHYIKTLASKGPLNAPWGVALAPSDFGRFANDLLIGNFGDGTINAFDPDTGDFLGTVTDTSGKPLTIDGLWALKFGNGGQGGDTDDVYFTAGPDDEQHGLFGEIAAEGMGVNILVGPEA